MSKPAMTLSRYTITALGLIGLTWVCTVLSVGILYSGQGAAYTQTQLHRLITRERQALSSHPLYALLTNGIQRVNAYAKRLAQPLTHVWRHDGLQPVWQVLPRQWPTVLSDSLSLIKGVSAWMGWRALRVGIGLACGMLVWCVAVVDGLVQRDRRRFAGARESSWLFHHSKRAFLRALLCALLVALIWPVAQTFEMVWLSAIIFTGVLLSLMLGLFKKYA